MTSYVSLLNKIETFCNAHLQIKKYGGEFREQMPNFATKDEKYPVVFVTPTSDTENLNTNQFTIDIYCVDIIQADRANLNSIISDCQLILKDIYVYYTNDNDIEIDVVGSASMSPLNNQDLDYVAGWVMSITFEVASYSDCAIPMNPISPNPPIVCDDATYQNSNSTYIQQIPSGNLFTSSDIFVTAYNSLDFDVAIEQSPSNLDVNIIIPDTEVALRNSLGNEISLTLLPSGIVGVVIAPDTTYNFIINGVTTSVTVPSLIDETINVVWQ